MITVACPFIEFSTQMRRGVTKRLKEDAYVLSIVVGFRVIPSRASEDSCDDAISSLRDRQIRPSHQSYMRTPLKLGIAMSLISWESRGCILDHDRLHAFYMFSMSVLRVLSPDR